METRGSYYWERSTRVVAPSFRLDATSPDGLTVSADYLIDTITSASVASGLSSDKAFTELRNDFGVGLGYELHLADDVHLRVFGRGHASIEPDYHSYGANGSLQLSLNQRSTLLTLSGGGNHDLVGKVFRGGMPMLSPSGRDLSNRGIVGTLDVASLSVAWSQLVTPQLEFEVGYDFGYLGGYQANPYRMVVVAGTPRPETHPDERFRHAAYGRLAYYVRETHTSVQALYRAYVDDWHVAAINPELRVYQELSREMQLRLRYRYYVQSASYFYRLQPDYAATDVYVTADPKMSAFESHTIGAQLLAYHLFLAAGNRRLQDVWPGVVLSIVLWIFEANLFTSWLKVNDYSRFYAGLTQVMSALVFFQLAAIIIILGAEVNRGSRHAPNGGGSFVLGVGSTAGAAQLEEAAGPVFAHAGEQAGGGVLASAVGEGPKEDVD